ncbi:tyrosine-type recombinase/integrase [Patescibacteria group bacterium]|nr:tyrosine-type recombinase/integrase [Patescibacteria group bacterium]MBU2579882.1 tyrosine-type recombinase/integrase [Patescibacteria group bacterium]
METIKLTQSIKNFLEYLKIRGKSHHTLISYSRGLDLFKKQLGNIPIDQITKRNLINYQLWLSKLKGKSSQNLSLATQSHYLIIIRSFIAHLQKQDYKIAITPQIIELPKISDREVTFLDRSELRKLLKAPLRYQAKPIINLRDKAILELLFSTGLRLFELTNLNKEQINFKQKELAIIGKGGKIRLVFLSGNAIDGLENYLKARKDNCPALFVRHDRDIIARLSPRGVQLLITKYSKLAKIVKKVTPHTMRRSFAVDLLNNGCNLYFVQKLLGHSSISTTERYLSVSNNFLKEAYHKFHDKRLTKKNKKDNL